MLQQRRGPLRRLDRRTSYRVKLVKEILKLIERKSTPPSKRAPYPRQCLELSPPSQPQLGRSGFASYLLDLLRQIREGLLGSAALRDFTLPRRAGLVIAGAPSLGSGCLIILPYLASGVQGLKGKEIFPRK